VKIGSYLLLIGYQKTVSQTVTLNLKITAMAKINYYLKGVPSLETMNQLQKQDRALYSELLFQQRPIICSISFDGRREIVTTGISSCLQYWDSKRQVVKSGKDAPMNRKIINETLEEKRKYVNNLLEEFQIQNRYLEKRKLASIFKDEKLDEELNTLEAIFKKFKSEHKTSKGFKVKYRSEQKYTTLMNQMKKFQGDEKFIPMRINNDWISRFRIYLQDRGINDNTVAKYITNLKTFKKFLFSIGIKLPAELENEKAIEKEQIVNILEMKEIELLEQFDFNNSCLAEIKDVFLFQCYTGQRYSDIEGITRNCITTKDEYTVWLLSSQKTDDNLVVPLNRKAIEILDRYKKLDTPLPRFTNQYFNKMLKEMARVAQLNRTVKLVYFYNNNKKEVTMPLHRAITSHIARKTFISLSTQKGIPERFVRDVSGHKTERSFKRYLNLGNSHLDAILKAWN